MPTRVIGGRYVVLGELGRGGMGIVWRAEDRVMGRHVAVKELHLPPGLPAQERLLFRERLLREARTAGRLNDPGIVTVHDVVTDDGVDHIVMELIEARTLTEVVAASGPLDERAVTAIGRALLAALRVAHEGGVVHRDVKPSNVMLAADGRVKLTDFGIAQAAEDPRLTTTGSMIGSPGFMSPERLEGGPATPAADLWAVGATLFHALQGRGPYDRETAAATISAVLHADPPPVRTRGPLGAVVTGLLQRSPQARLTGVQAEALLASPGGASPPPDVPTTPLTAPARSRRPWLIAVGVALVAGLVGGLVGGFALARAGDPDVRTLTYGEGGDVPVYDVAYLYCLQVRPDPGVLITSSATVDCDAPHAAEVFAVVESFGTQEVLPYPARLPEFAAAACAMRFDSGLLADRDGVQVTALLPAEAEFRRDGGSGSFQDRDVFCLLTTTDGSQLTGSRLTPTG
ncbi:serine/threonine-protein kinase [Pseudonocardia broussonetiae]|uniref:non-specific serine/threonine protein kinase n=1 Tax=Pseudonocardia broussonetiae TaxID=2736640 RepID=A0A6M6JJN6_9PSEU|nr:serine/threonine-protein kinase [Pseudonocardia broussonetiae]QJY46571.1 protein kinase [Pseudonocardia broussonetiae]